jgi:hypothetical protein
MYLNEHISLLLYYSPSNSKCVHDVLQFKFFVVCSSTKLKSSYIVVLCFLLTYLKHYNVDKFINFLFVIIRKYYIPHFHIHVALKH